MTTLDRIIGITAITFPLLAFAGCGKDSETPNDKPSPPPTEKPSEKPTEKPTEKPSEKPTEKPDKKLKIKIYPTTSTAATDKQFKRGDKVGIYTINYTDGVPGTLAQSGNHLDNIGFTFDGTSEWNTDHEVYWKDESTIADFYCYYPYMAEITNIHSVPHAVKTEQNSLASYKASKFLYGKTYKAEPSETAVNISTKNIMSDLIIELKPGKGYTNESLDAEDISITISGLKTEGTIDLTTGICSASGMPQNIIPYKFYGQWIASVIPQKITDSGSIKIKVGKHTYEESYSIDFKPNFQHKCTFIVNMLNNGVNIGIEGWQSDENDYGGILE